MYQVHGGMTKCGKKPISPSLLDKLRLQSKCQQEFFVVVEECDQRKRILLELNGGTEVHKYAG